MWTCWVVDLSGVWELGLASIYGNAVVWVCRTGTRTGNRCLFVMCVGRRLASWMGIWETSLLLWFLSVDF